MNLPINDPYFGVEVLSSTRMPQTVIYAAMHQDYSEDPVYEQLFEKRSRTHHSASAGVWTEDYSCPSAQCPSENEAGRRVVKHLLKGGRGHYGPLEHPTITLNVMRYPHSTMQQLRTHRTGVSFDVQSFRYTGQNIYRLGEIYNEDEPAKIPAGEDLTTFLEKVFYIRPEGEYRDRQGARYIQTQLDRAEDITTAFQAAEKYFLKVKAGKSEEHARGIIPFDVRQSWVMTVNVRSLMHILDLRAKPDAQLEIQDLCYRLGEIFLQWCPEIAEWYMENRWMKARLSP